ncbi:MAG: DUF1192 family protein [Rhodospirillaceae bacterium]|nr:DUF1192 family protein [Rhodospirillaceae bacterium]
MDDEDLQLQHIKKNNVKLDEMSIEAIGEHIANLEVEIERARVAIKLKEGARDGANSLFKT